MQARDNKLAIEDMAGGTFTISNGGVFGSLMGTPIINMPQTAVLGLHAIKDKPVAINGKVEIRPVRLFFQPLQLNLLADILNTDDVPGLDIRPPSAGRQRSRDIFGQSEGIHRGPTSHADCLIITFHIWIVLACTVEREEGVSSMMALSLEQESEKRVMLM